MRARLVVTLLAGLLASSAHAGQATVTGVQVPARPDAPAVAATTSVRSLYGVHCAGCHGLDGAGSKLGNVPDVRRLGAFLRLPGGRAFVVSVPGVMGSGLDDRQVAEVTNWVLATLARDSLPEGHRPYEASEVALARSGPLLDVAAVRRRLVDQARERGIAID
jgi:mono/diheme cytochrome c family protein